MLGADITIAVVALIEHKAVEAIFITAGLGRADTFRGFQALSLFP